jgi:TM2 domain-containing membrane protein YozV
MAVNMHDASAISVGAQSETEIALSDGRVYGSGANSGDSPRPQDSTNNNDVNNGVQNKISCISDALATDKDANEEGAANNSTTSVEAVAINSNNNSAIQPKINPNLLLHPVVLFTIAFLTALVYTLIPSSSPTGAILASCFWNLPGTAAIVEIFCICLPGTSDELYVAAYVLGYSITQILQAIAVSTGANKNQIYSTLAITSSAVVPSFVFLYHALVYSRGPTTDSLAEPVRDTEAVHWPADVQITAVIRPTVVSLVPFDTFSSSFTLEEEKKLLLTPVKSKSMLRASNLRRIGGLAKAFRKSLATIMSRSNSRTSADVEEHEERNGSTIQDVENPMVDMPAIGVTKSRIASSDSAISTATSVQNEDICDSAEDEIEDEHSKAYLEWLETRIKANQIKLAAAQNPIPDTVIADNQKAQRSTAAILFCFLPRFWMGKESVYLGKINDDKVKLLQWLLTVLFICLYNGYYDSLCEFTYKFRSVNNHMVRIAMFFLFILMGLAFRLGLKRVGLSLDKRKHGTASMYFFGEVMSLFFYFTFYRVLFESVSSWLTFFGFQALHLGTEWVMYPLRGHKSVYHWLIHIEEKVSWLRGVLLPPQLDYKDFLNFLALDFGIRVLVMVAASVSMLLLLIVIDNVPWITNNLFQSGPRAHTTYALILASVGLELINAYFMHYVFFKKMCISIPNKIVHCFQRESFALVSCLVAANLFINPVFAFNRTHR